MNLKYCRSLLVGLVSIFGAVASPGQSSFTLVPFGAVWRYLDNGVDQGTNWIGSAFDDSGWASGPGQLGFGDGDEATVLTRGAGGNSYTTFYFRHTFNVQDPAAISGLEVSLRRDDGVVVYLNDTEVFRDNLPPGPVTYNTFALQFVQDDGNLILSNSVMPSLLVAGPNVLAVEIHQNAPTSSDISFDLQLTAEVAAGPPLILVQPASTSALDGGSATFTVEAAGQAPLSYQWDFNGGLIDGATNATLMLSNVSTNDAGTYRVRISNSLGSVVSGKATLSIIDAGSGLVDDFEPDIDRLQWLDFGGMVLATNYGGSVSGANSLWFGGDGSRYATTRPLDTTSGGTISFQLRISDGNDPNWEQADLPGEGVVLEYSLDGGANWVNLATYDTTAYSAWSAQLLPIPVAAEAPGVLFRWRQLNNSGTGLDHWAIDDVIIAVGPSAPSIFQEPSDLTAAAGGTAVFRVVASGSQPLAYQWDFNGADIMDATNDTLTLTMVSTNAAGSYRVRISNALGSATSRKASLKVVELGDDAFQILALTANNSFAIEHNATAGDDRGGIAVSSTHVFYTGDSGTARFNLGDLSGATSVGMLYDALVSDLRSGIVYSLGNGSSLISNSGGTVTTLIEINGETGALTGNRVNLSAPITMTSDFGSVGLFAGFGRIVLHNGSHVFSISLPTGTVVDLGAMNPVTHTFCENWAHWGVAEFFNGNVYLVYVQDQNNIVRARVPDGATSTVANFPGLGLSDMCSITVAPTRNRWYFHHEGTSIFRSGDETIGYADAFFNFNQPNTPPMIGVQPQDQSALEGMTISLNAFAFGGQPITYQWYYNGMAIDGAVTNGLTLTSVATNQSGNYLVVASNSLGQATSDVAHVTITLPRGVVGYYADNSFYNPDLSASLVRARFVPLHITNIVTFDLSSVDILMLTEENVSPSPDLLRRSREIEQWINDGGRLVIHDGVYTYNSPMANPLVPALPTTLFQSQPSDDINITIPGGLPISQGPFGAINNTTLDNGSFSAWGYALRASLPASAIPMLNVGTDTSQIVSFSYGLGAGFVYVSTIPLDFLVNNISPIGPVLENAYLPNVLDYMKGLVPTGPPLIGSHPQSFSILEGVDTSLSLAATGEAPLSYQWYFNGGPIGGANGPVLEIPSISTNMAGTYYVVVTNRLGSATSRSATVMVLILEGDSFRITSLSTNNSLVVEHENVTGDYRGALGASGSKIFYTGDNGTASFNLDDLSAGPLLGEYYHALVSNLRTETLYLLGNDAGPLQEQGGEVTTLLELEDETGSLTGNSVKLSDPINLPGYSGNVGIFAGFDRIVLLTGSRAYHISLPSGQVLDLGFMPTPPHMFTETWAYWGLAEFFNGDLYIDYVRDPQTIVRTRVPDGLTTTLASFENLANTASFTVSLSEGRWYFQHRGASQFGGQFETLGYADAGFDFVIPPGPPVIRSQPTDQNVFSGANVTMRVRATGSEPFRYQWQFNGSDLPNETNSTLHVNGVTLLQRGVYRVSITNPLGTTNSAPATLNVLSAAPFRITSLGTSNSRVTDHNNITGDDRGGIAISSSHVFYTGDEFTGSFQAADLSGGARAAGHYDAMVSDLATETVYTLANGSGPLDSNGGTVTSLIELDGITLSPTSTRINLSSPITVTPETGIFAGFGRVVLHTGSRVYSIEIPSGLVLDLGSMSMPSHSGCENWAFWGVAEVIDGAVYLVYTGPFNNEIVRTRVPDGMTSLVEGFNGLSDMCSITVSPSRGRWYFHYEGSGQFGGTAETIGYADATFEYNKPPTVSFIPIRRILEDESTGPLDFTVVDDTTPGSNLVFSAYSTNSVLVPTNNIVIAAGPNGTNFTVTVTPAPDLYGNTFILVNVQDEVGNVSILQFGVSVRALNDPPTITLGPDLMVSDTDGPQTYPGWATDISPGPPNESDQSLTFLVTNDNSGLFLAGPALNTNGDLTFTPAPGAIGIATVDVQLKDDGGTSGINVSPVETFHITVMSANQPPTVAGGEFGTREDTPLNGTVAAQDPDGDTLVLTVIDPPAGGQVTLNNDGSFVFTPAPQFNGMVRFTFRADDGQAQSDPATVTILVTPVNDPPVFNKGPDISVDEDSGPQSVPAWATGLSPGPPDEGGQALQFLVGVDQPSLFSAPPSIAPNGTLTFTPAANAHGGAVVTVRLKDDGGASNGGADTSPAQTFALTIRSINDPPTVTGVSVVGNEDQPVNGTVTGQDVDGDALTFSVVTASPNGTAAMNADGTFTFTPAADFSGPTSFTFKASDGVTNSPQGTVTVTVNPVNDPPTFTPGPGVTVKEDAGPQVLPQWATAIRPGPDNESGQEVHFLVNTDNNRLFSERPSLDPDGTLRFTALPDCYGTASVTVVAMDNGGTDRGGVDTSPTRTFTITLLSVNDPPAFTKGADVAVDEDAGPQTVPGWATGISAGPAKEAGQTVSFHVQNDQPDLFAAGPAVLPNGTLTFTPGPDRHGRALVTVTLQDSGGTENGGTDLSDPQTFSITIRAANDRPVAQSLSLSVNEDTALDVELTATDADGDALTYSVTKPMHGILSGVAPHLVYHPEANYHGPDSFTFTANDGTEDSLPATVSIQVLSVNDAPTAVALAAPLAAVSPLQTNLTIIASNNKEAAVILDGTASSDPENDPLDYSWFEEGSLVPFASGALVTNVFGVGEFSVLLVVDDGHDLGFATVEFEVAGPGRAVEMLIEWVDASSMSDLNKRPLIASLSAAVASFDRESFTSGLNQLQAFQNKVAAQIAPVDSELARAWIRAAQIIRDAVSPP
jgi:Reelin subrepeat B/Bacterial Ig domain/Immunoglobulin domain/Immunoglobulin I-set domain